MLSEEEKREIDEEARRYPLRSAAAIDALKVVQRHRGWVPDEAIRDLADFLGVSAADLDGVATFYNLIFRKPVGRHVILLCDSVSCWILGSDRIKEAMSARLGIDYGETTADGLFTLLPNPCLGACDHAPALMVDGEHFQDLDGPKACEALERFRREEAAP